MTNRKAQVYDPTQEFEVKTVDVEYRKEGNTSWLATVYQPDGDGPFPAVLYVHGREWTAGSRLEDKEVDRALASSGLVIAAFDVGVAPKSPYPEQVVATNYATRWLKTHAEEYNANASRVGGMGNSSGGHTIMLSGMRPRDTHYATVPLEGDEDVDATLDYIIARYPVIDPYARYLHAKETGLDKSVSDTEGYFGKEETMREANPQAILERGEKLTMPPILILQGTNDSEVPKAIPDRFADAYRLAGGSVDLHWFQNVEHAFDLKEGVDTDRAVASMKSFIARRLSLAAPVTNA